MLLLYDSLFWICLTTFRMRNSVCNSLSCRATTRLIDEYYMAGSAIGFKLDSLLKLTDTRARNSKMTLMHYLCKVWFYLWLSSESLLHLGGAFFPFSWQSLCNDDDLAYSSLCWLWMAQVVAEKLPDLLDFHDDLPSLEAATKVPLQQWYY